MLGTILLAWTLQGGACVDCGLLADGRAHLCAVHAEEERKAFDGTRKALASNLESERMSALEILAHLTTAHVNAPSDRVARRIADALKDEFPAVRESAVGLLGRPQHALICMESLLEAIAASEKEMDRLVKIG